MTGTRHQAGGSGANGDEAAALAEVEMAFRRAHKDALALNLLGAFSRGAEPSGRVHSDSSKRQRLIYELVAGLLIRLSRPGRS